MAQQPLAGALKNKPFYDKLLPNGGGNEKNLS